MFVNRESELFETIIPLKNRVEAEKFRSYQSQPSKRKQVYLNTLAVFAVNLYLNSIGWATDLKASDSWNPALQTMMDVADLQIPSYGKLECRFVLNGDDRVTIPPEVWSERIAYIVVQFDESLDRARLLGFIRQVTQSEIPLSQLESLSDLPIHLSQQRRAALVQTPTISKWFSEQSGRDWQQIEDFFAPSLAINYRNPQKLASQTKSQLSKGVNRVKLIQLGESNEIVIALIINVQSQNNKPEDMAVLEEFNISLTACNSQLQNYLPEGLELIILDRDGRPVMIAQANETETIEFCFSGKLGESFSVELALEEQIKVERFII